MTEIDSLTKVLIIDDDINTTDMLRMTLEASGFEVLKAASPALGIDLALQQHPDAIILDFVMPVMNGVDVCRTIRSFSQVPILMMSVIDQPSIVAKVLDAGADDYLVKPVAVNVLQANLNKLSRRRPPAPGGSSHPLPYQVN
jgi:two-component system KDP operon response regulator KdpE